MKTHRSLLPLALALLCTGLTSNGLAGGMGAPNDGLSNYLKQQCNAGHFSGEALVARGNKVIFEFSCTAPGVKPEPGRVFRIGSNTKQFTAALILKLQEAGKLKLSDPVGKYLPDFPHGEITLTQLLNHTSGLKEYTEMDGEEKRYSLNDVIDLFRNEPLNFKPGDRFDYSNSGYALLTKVIEVISKERYEDYLKHTLLNPLGMDKTGYSSRAEVIPGLKTGYLVNPEKPKDPPIAYDLGDAVSIAVGAGGLYSTAMDLLKWDRALFSGKVLGPQSLALIHHASVPVAGRIAQLAPDSMYGYGWLVGPLATKKAIWHGGTIPGFRTYNAYIPDDDLTVILLSNLYTAPTDVEKILKTVVRTVETQGRR